MRSTKFILFFIFCLFLKTTYAQNYDVLILINGTPYYHNTTANISCGIQNLNISATVIDQFNVQRTDVGITCYNYSYPSGWSQASVNYCNRIITTNSIGDGAIELSWRVTVTTQEYYIGTTKVFINRPTPKLPVFQNAPTSFCFVNQSQTFTVSALNAGSYTWETTNGLLINGQSSPLTTTSNSVNISTPSNISSITSAQISVRANPTSGNSNCGSSPSAVRYLTVGAPLASLLSVSGQGMTVTTSGLALAPIYNGSLISSTPNSQNINQVEWQSLSSSIYVSQSGITATAYLTNGCVGGVANMRVRVRNVCGFWSDWRVFTINVCSFSGFRFVYSPNPTSEVLTITAVPTEENKNLTIVPEIDFEVKLLDQDGKIVREGKNQDKEKKISFDIKGLKEGAYYLHISHGKEIEKYQILVKK